MKYLQLASRELNTAIRMLEKVKDGRVQQIINNLKEEEHQLDTLLMNEEDKHETTRR